MEEECGNIPIVLVMTKMDLLYRAEIDMFEVEKLSRSLWIHLVKTSVKENINVQKVITQGFETYILISPIFRFSCILPTST